MRPKKTICLYQKLVVSGWKRLGGKGLYKQAHFAIMKNHIQRLPAKVIAWDLRGDEYAFDKIINGCGDNIIYVASRVCSMYHRTLPVGLLFNLFGKDVTIRAGYDYKNDEGMISVISNEYYSPHNNSNSGEDVVVTHHIWTQMIEEAGGDCADLCIGVSFENSKTLVLSPLISTWSSMSTTTRLYKLIKIILLIAVIASPMVYKFSESLWVKEVIMLIVMMFKDYIMAFVI